MYSEYLSIGEVLKPQGVHGQVKVRPDTDDPARFLSLDCVYIKQGEAYQKIAITQTSARPDGFVYCNLNHADSREQADLQRGWMLYVDRAHAVPLAENQYFISDLLDCRIQNRNGDMIGTIKEVLQPGANDVYVIKAKQGTIYLPVLPFVIDSVHVREGYVIVNEERFPEVAVFED